MTGKGAEFIQNDVICQNQRHFFYVKKCRYEQSTKKSDIET